MILLISLFGMFLKMVKKYDLNSPFFIIEDYNRKYALYRQLGKIKIDVEKASVGNNAKSFLPFGKDLPLPHIVFYEYDPRSLHSSTVRYVFRKTKFTVTQWSRFGHKHLVT